jgi:hypothetical protein
MHHVITELAVDSEVNILGFHESCLEFLLRIYRCITILLHASRNVKVTPAWQWLAPGSGHQLGTYQQG